MRNDPKVVANWIHTINSEGYGLSDWEGAFMESVTEQFEARGTLTEKQEEIVERIYCEKT